MEDILTIGKRMKAIRQELKLSQQKLADRLDIDRGLLAQIETDNTKPNLIILSNFVRITNTSYEFLIDGIGIAFLEGSDQVKNSESTKDKIAPKIAPMIAPKGENQNETIQTVSEDQAKYLNKTDRLEQEIKELKEKLRYADLAIDSYQRTIQAYEDVEAMKKRVEIIEKKIDKTA